MQDILMQPGCALARTLGHCLQGELLIVVVKDFKAVVTPIADAFQAKDQIGQLLAVDALPWKDSKSSGGGHALFEGGRFVPHEI